MVSYINSPCLCVLLAAARSGGCGHPQEMMHFRPGSSTTPQKGGKEREVITLSLSLDDKSLCFIGLGRQDAISVDNPGTGLKYLASGFEKRQDG